MAATGPSTLADKLYALVPEDGSGISNLALRHQCSDAMRSEVSGAAYFAARDALLAAGKTLVLEVKGEDSEQNRTKRAAMDAWVGAVNAKGGFGVWCSDVAYEVAALQDVLARHAGAAP